MWNPLAWLLNFIRGERRRIANKLQPLAVAVAEDLFNRDWDGDGIVAEARTELRRLLMGMNPVVLNGILASYVTESGAIRTDVISILPVEVLKKVLAIALLVHRLRATGWPVSLDAIIKQGYSLLDSVLQAAFEGGRKG